MLELAADLAAVVRLAARRLTPAGDVVFTYEPIIGGFGEQSERHHVAPGRRSDGTAIGITKHRWHPGEVDGVVAGAAILVRAHRLFVAYHNPQAPIVYGIVWASRDAA